MFNAQFSSMLKIGNIIMHFLQFSVPEVMSDQQRNHPQNRKQKSPSSKGLISTVFSKIFGFGKSKQLTNASNKDESSYSIIVDAKRQQSIISQSLVRNYHSIFEREQRRQNFINQRVNLSKNLHPMASTPQQSVTPTISDSQNQATPESKQQQSIQIEKRKDHLKNLLKKYKELSQIYEKKEVGPRKQKKLDNCQKWLRSLGGIFLRNQVSRANLSEINSVMSQIEVELMILEDEAEQCKDKQPEIDEQDRPVLTLREEMELKQKFEEELNKQKEKIKQLEERENAMKEEKLCVVCMDQEKCYMNVACKHVSCCKNCIRALERCPICREEIYEFEKVYQ